MIDLDLVGTSVCPSCRGRKARSNLACRDCWRRVPQALRDAVYAALRAWENDPDLSETAGRLGALRDAQRAALTAAQR